MKIHITYYLSRTIVLVALLGITACGATSAPPPTATSAPSSEPEQTNSASFDGRIVAMGDSLTEGFGVEEAENYPSQLNETLSELGYNYELINAGINGETTSGALSRVDWVLRLQPDIVILEIGGNDSLRGVDLSVTEDNLRQLVEKLKAEDVIVVLAGMQTLRNLGPEYGEQFGDLYPTIAEENPDVIFIPFFLEGVAGEIDLNLPDFIHPTDEGYAIVVQTILPYVIEAIERHQTATQ